MKTTRRGFIQTVAWSSAAAIVPWQTPVAGSTEVWEIYNLSEDVHPMHFHLVNVQVINPRRARHDAFIGRDLGGRLLPSIVLWGRPWKFRR